MNDQDLMHGEDYAGQDVDGWLASEKAEGVCLAWDGALLWTRSGRNITAPTWFLSALPRGQRIIGELWAGRGRFQDSRNATNHGRWCSDLRLMAFDAPDAPGTWAQRMARSAGSITSPRRWATWVSFCAPARRPTRKPSAKSATGMAFLLLRW